MDNLNSTPAMPDNNSTTPNNSAPLPPPMVPAYNLPQIPKVRVPMNAKDFSFAIITLITSIFSVYLSFYGNFNLGFALSFFVLAVIIVLYIKNKITKIKPFSLYCGICALLCAGVFPIYCDYFSKFMLFVAIFALSAICVGGLTDSNKYSEKSYQLIFDILRICIAIPLMHMSDMLFGLFSSGEGDSKGKKSSIILGIVCALPVLFVLIPLLVSSDAAFEGIVNTVLGKVDYLVVSLIFGVILFIILFSLLFAIVKGLAKNEREFSYIDRSISKITINSFLSMICAVYVIYLFSQLAYFFNAFSSILPEKYTVAEYTRRGFFEMAVICVINLMLIFVSLVFSRKENGKIALSTRLIALFVAAFSLVLISTVGSKMFMYISSFGMTRLRILVSVFMLVLCFIFLFVIIKLFAPKFSYMRYIVIAVTVIGITVAYADIDRVIAKYNTEMYLNGTLQTIDVSAFENLSDSAVPYLVKLLDNSDKTVAQVAKSQLQSRASNYYDIDYKYNSTTGYSNIMTYKEKPTGFKSYNYTQSVAKQLIFDNIIKDAK